MHRIRARRIWEFKKSQGVEFVRTESWVSASDEDGWLSELAEALQRVTHVRGEMEKSE